MTTRVAAFTIAPGTEPEKNTELIIRGRSLRSDFRRGAERRSKMNRPVSDRKVCLSDGEGSGTVVPSHRLDYQYNQNAGGSQTVIVMIPEALGVFSALPHTAKPAIKMQRMTDDTMG